MHAENKTTWTVSNGLWWPPSLLMAFLKIFNAAAVFLKSFKKHFLWLWASMSCKCPDEDEELSSSELVPFVTSPPKRNKKIIKTKFSKNVTETSVCPERLATFQKQRVKTTASPTRESPSSGTGGWLNVYPFFIPLSRFLSRSINQTPQVKKTPVSFWAQSEETPSCRPTVQLLPVCLPSLNPEGGRDCLVFIFLGTQFSLPINKVKPAAYREKKRYK